MTLLKQERIDWDEFLTLASAAHLSASLEQALNYLMQKFDAPIPTFVLNALQQMPCHLLERREIVSHKKGRPYLAAWHRFCINHKLWTTWQRLWHAHQYLQATARLKSPWSIPWFALGWCARRIYKNAFKRK